MVKVINIVCKLGEVIHILIFITNSYATELSTNKSSSLKKRNFILSSAATVFDVTKSFFPSSVYHSPYDCGQITVENVAQFRTPVKELYSSPTNCDLTVKTSFNTCGIRVDFLDTKLAPATNKVCYEDVIRILNKNKNDNSFNAPFCGNLQGYSAVLRVNGTDEIQVIVIQQNVNSKWNIRITQVKCEVSILPEIDACGFRNSRSRREIYFFVPRKQRVNNRWLRTKEEDNTVLSSTSNSSEMTPETQTKAQNLFKIVSGMETTPNEYPWIVLILLDDELHCSGSLISHTWIITAAHCTSSSTEDTPSIGKYLVALGVHNRSLLIESGRVLRGLSNIVRHPQYQGTNYDIALMKLNASVPYSTTIRPICLPRNSGDTYVEGALGIVAGWGATNEAVNSDTLLAGTLPLVSTSYCRYAWHQRGIQIVDSMLCAGLKGTSTCEGDSGSPLMLEDSGLYYIIGVNSFGAPPKCGSTVYPDVFMRITAFLDWIAVAIIDVGQK